MTISGACSEFPYYPHFFTLEFPAGSDLGELWLIEDVNCFTCGTGEKYLGRAKGSFEIELPAPHWYVSLRMPKNASALLPHLKHPSLTNIGDLNLRGSDVTDDDLKHIEGINLRSINLSKTKINGSGLKYLHPNSKWTFVDLEDCDTLNPEYLAHFRGWTRATIRVLPRKSTGGQYSDRSEERRVG